MRIAVILEPHDYVQMMLDYLVHHPIETELDFIEAITGHQNLTQAWNQFGLKLGVIMQLKKAAPVPS
jgi:hypothetical protein